MRQNDEVGAIGHAIEAAEAFHRLAYIRAREIIMLRDRARVWMERMHPSDAANFDLGLRDVQAEAEAAEEAAPQ